MIAREVLRIKLEYMNLLCERTDKQTDRQTYIHADHNILHPTGGDVKKLEK